jgi:hypothetical protein
MKVIKIRVVLDTQDEVFRDFEVLENGTLEDLHEAILASFDQSNDQMASFYLSDEEWNKGEEFVLMDMGEDALLMKDAPLSMVQKVGSRLLYVYDFMNLKIFYVEVLEVNEADESKEYPYLYMALGSIPPEEDIYGFEGLMAGIEEEEGDHNEREVRVHEEEEGDWYDDEDSNTFEDLDDYEGLL